MRPGIIGRDELGNGQWSGGSQMILRLQKALQKRGPKVKSPAI
jgi:hypothetical protein